MRCFVFMYCKNAVATKEISAYKMSPLRLLKNISKLKFFHANEQSKNSPLFIFCQILIEGTVFIVYYLSYTSYLIN